MCYDFSVKGRALRRGPLSCKFGVKKRDDTCACVRARIHRKERSSMNDLQRTFAHEWMIDKNAYAAALRAGYSQATARNAAAWIHPEHPTKPKLRAYCDQLMAQQSKRLGITADRVLTELAKIGFVNFDDVCDPETGKVRPEASREDKAVIAGVKIMTGETDMIEVKMYDKTRALELLGKHLGIFTENVKMDGAVPVIVDDG